MKLVKQRLVRERVAEGVVLAAFRHAERDTVRVEIGGRYGFAIRSGLVILHGVRERNEANAERKQTRVQHVGPRVGG